MSAFSTLSPGHRYVYPLTTSLLHFVIGCQTKMSSLSRHNTVVINRLHIGRTRFTNSYLLKGENQPECQACQSSLTVKNILIDCTHLSAVHQRYFRVDTLKDSALCDFLFFKCAVYKYTYLLTYVYKLYVLFQTCLLNTAMFDRLRSSQCSASKIFQSRYTERTF